jgi:hypothetical protein
MEMAIYGIPFWIIGVIGAIAAYAIPQVMLQEHPRKWSSRAQLVSASFMILGIGLALTTK